MPVVAEDLAAARRRLRGRFFGSYLWRDYLESRRFWIRGQLARIKWWVIRMFTRR
jgi:hypothetical protein